MNTTEFSRALLGWYDQGHRALPWRDTSDPYRIWISEIMLQQTRAETVVSYYERFTHRFPDVRALALAPEQDVLKAWEGLGYYSRARNLQSAAKKIMDEFGGRMPQSAAQLKSLPGIGPYTAGAVASICFGERVAAVDGNVERVVSRLFLVREDVTLPAVRRVIAEKAQSLVPAARTGDFTNAMMELGATVCVPGAPRCLLCPARGLCEAQKAGVAAQLPVKRKAKAQRVERMGVAVVRCGGRVLLRQRSERLLGGLWVFPLFKDAVTPALLSAALWDMGLEPIYDGPLGGARHVFTHIVWDMQLHAFVQEDGRTPPECRWADAAQLRALPLPTAVKAARREALRLLETEAGPNVKQKEAMPYEDLS